MSLSKLTSLLFATLLSAGSCESTESPPPGPFDPPDGGSPATPAVDSGAPVDAGTAPDAADDAAGCQRSPTTAKVVITGKILFQGQPHSGFARLRDRQSGGLAAEASVNDAGFFLLNSSVESPATCEDWWIEIENNRNATPAFSGELDANALIREALAEQEQNVDISAQPIVVQ